MHQINTNGCICLPGESHGVASLIMPFWVCQHFDLIILGLHYFWRIQAEANCRVTNPLPRQTGWMSTPS